MHKVDAWSVGSVGDLDSSQDAGDDLKEIGLTVSSTVALRHPTHTLPRNTIAEKTHTRLAHVRNECASGVPRS